MPRAEIMRMDGADDSFATAKAGQAGAADGGLKEHDHHLSREQLKHLRKIARYMQKHDLKLTMEFCSDAVCLNTVGSYQEKIYKHLLERRHKLEQDDSEASAIVQTHAGDARAKDKNGQRRGGTKGAGTRDVAPAAGVALVTVPPKVPGRGAPRPAPPAAGPAEPAGLAAARAPAEAADVQLARGAVDSPSPRQARRAAAAPAAATPALAGGKQLEAAEWRSLKDVVASAAVPFGTKGGAGQYGESGAAHRRMPACSARFTMRLGR